MTSRVLYCFLVLTMSLGFVCPRAQAQRGDAQFEKLQDDYLKIKNRDPSVKNPSDWETLAAAFRAYSQKSKHEAAPRALLNAITLERTLAKSRGDSAAAERMVLDVKTFSKNLGDSELADDALLQLGEYYQDIGDTQNAALEFFEIGRRYPSSDSAAVAQAHSEAAAYRAEGKLAKTVNAQAHSDERYTERYTVVLDPGHGGDDFGSVGVGGVYEKDVVLSFASALESAIRKRLPAEVLLTRREDRFIPLQERAALANKKSAVLFVSLHTNASVKKNSRGIEVYVLDDRGDGASRKLAERENTDYGAAGEGDDLAFIVSDLIQQGKSPLSATAALDIKNTLSADLAAHAKELGAITIKHGPFSVLVGAHMPAVLIELGYLDHEEEGVLLMQDNYRAELADAIAHGVEDFITQKKVAASSSSAVPNVSSSKALATKKSPIKKTSSKRKK